MRRDRPGVPKRFSDRNRNPIASFRQIVKIPLRAGTQRDFYWDWLHDPDPEILS
jgi:hypothetical protein